MYNSIQEQVIVASIIQCSKKKRLSFKFRVLTASSSTLNLITLSIPGTVTDDTSEGGWGAIFFFFLEYCCSRSWVCLTFVGLSETEKEKKKKKYSRLIRPSQIVTRTHFFPTPRSASSYCRAGGAVRGVVGVTDGPLPPNFLQYREGNKNNKTIYLVLCRSKFFDPPPPHTTTGLTAQLCDKTTITPDFSDYFQ